MKLRGSALYAIDAPPKTVSLAPRFKQEAYVKASNTSSNDYFGNAVALSADGSTLAVGAQYEDSDATGIGGDGTNNTAPSSGAAYVMAR